jgi:hypothetical protein
MIQEADSHEPRGKVASTWRNSHDPEAQQTAVVLAFDSHDPGKVTLTIMEMKPPNRTLAGPAARLPPAVVATAAAAVVAPLSAAGAAALAAAQALARNATAAATLRAYKADWTHFSQWCAAHGFVPVPAAPDIVGAYLASLAAIHAPSAAAWPHWEKCIGSTTCHGTRRTVTSRDRCRARCAKASARCKRPLP